MKIPSLLSLIALATPALTSGDSISGAMSQISSTTTTLGNTVAAWNGLILTTLPILTQSTELLHNIKNGTKTAKASEVLDFGGAIEVAGATQALAGVVNKTLQIIIDSKHKFDKRLLSPVILLNLELQKDATEDFSNAVIAKVPEALQETAKGLVKPITDSFDKAIHKYALFQKRELLSDIGRKEFRA
ncbi:Fc.00g094720.m01.CDS01 [Cosmosporella sp. VM-42]